MNYYVALLRGISPSNPNMRNENLRKVFEELGFVNVRTVISSGNVLFETDSTDVEELEGTIEKALYEKLGFTSTAIIKSRDELNLLVSKNPFKDLEDSPKSKLNVTFLKSTTANDLEFPFHGPDNGFTLLCCINGAVFSSVNLTVSKTPVLMRWLEKEFGKDITTRTWKTIGRIIKKLDEF
jgi:uncharacterized protein (DUF1697 family)